MGIKETVCCKILCGMLLLFGLCGCAVPQQPADSSLRCPPVQDAGQRAWDEAVRAFDAEDYRKAAGLFEVLSGDASKRECADRALFALAVTRLMLARSPHEYSEALNAWNKWNSGMHLGLSDEQTRMLTPLLVRLGPASGPPDKDDPSLAQPKKPSVKEANTNYRGMLQSKEKEIDTLRTKLDQREREVRRLRHQLESLEAIHRKYQERKQGASPP